ncbi:hypothetical protein OpiT1DRAFT_01717 [Opitutaceae bacterium TAV1]|nr:hypothetical protein OpiT1DRAFT_01717 [Opitutaceae bacterium TAV1]
MLKSEKLEDRSFADVVWQLFGRFDFSFSVFSLFPV